MAQIKCPSCDALIDSEGETVLDQSPKLARLDAIEAELTKTKSEHQNAIKMLDEADRKYSAEVLKSIKKPSRFGGGW